ncbi:MAG TPA: hypothetical protein VL991_06360 [Terracidiphilus sp.]|nr:hypothetical protein [Terracidiphilus sp.]
MATHDPEAAAHHPALDDSAVFRSRNQTLRADLILTLPVVLFLAIGI